METLTEEQVQMFQQWFFDTGYNKHAAGELTDQIDRMLTYYKMHVISNDHHIAHATPSSKRLKDTG